MLKVEKLSKAYAGDPVLEEVSFTVGSGERVGLVGRNGSGKTTLMRIIAGEESPDSGTVSVPRGYRTAYLTQHIRFTERTVLAEACSALPRDEDGTDLTYRARAVLGGLGFSTDELDLNPSELSGGYQVRLNLARALLSAPDMLLLDEPTNYLDIISLRWLRRFLRGWRGEFLLITHDREFMDSVTTHTMGIHRRRVRKTAGATDKFYSLIEQAEEVHEKTRLNREKKQRETERFIERFRSKATKARAVQSRIKALEREERLEVLEGVRTLSFGFNPSRSAPRTLVRLRGAGFGYPGEDALFSGLDLTVGRGDKIAVVGKNGRGKTTLLNLIAGELAPTAGAVDRNEGTALQCFGQTNVARLDPEKTVEEELVDAHPDRSRGGARRVAGAMLFEGDHALKRVRVLSGGEKSRVLLGKLILSPTNLLLLDEPTNHLDMESTEALAGAIEAYPGAVVIVTHSEMILDRVARRLVVFDRGRVEVYDGPYRDFLEKVGWSEEDREAGGAAGRAPAAGRTKKDLRKARAEVAKERTRELHPLKLAMGRVEDEITALEERLDRLNRALAEASGIGSADEISGLSRQRHDVSERIEALFDDLERLSSEHEEKKRAFDSRLKELD